MNSSPPKTWGIFPILTSFGEEAGISPHPLANANKPQPGLEGEGGLRALLPPILFITILPTLPIGIYPSPFSCTCLSTLASLVAMSLSISFQFSFDVIKVIQNDIITLTSLVDFHVQ